MLQKDTKISWKDRVKNEKILRQLQTKYHFMEDMMKRKMKYAGHVLRGSSGLFHLQILEVMWRKNEKSMHREECGRRIL